jgi:hypothetical protein
MTHPTTQPTVTDQTPAMTDQTPAMTDQIPAMTEPPIETVESLIAQMRKVVEFTPEELRQCDRKRIMDAILEVSPFFNKIVLLKYPKKVAMKKIREMSRIKADMHNPRNFDGIFVIMDALNAETNIFGNGLHLNRRTERICHLKSGVPT